MTWQATAEITRDGPCPYPGQAPDDERLPDQLALAAVPSAPGRARRHLLRVLREWGLDVLADTAGLLASELVTNAVKISGNAPRLRGGPPGMPAVISFMVRRTGAGLVLEVWDPAAEPPVRRESDPLGEGGRGLFLVEVLSSGWGHYGTVGGGKVVWCEVPLPAGVSGGPR